MCYFLHRLVAYVLGSTKQYRLPNSKTKAADRMDEENMNAANKKSQELLAYHKKGTDYIKKALSIDENSG